MAEVPVMPMANLRDAALRVPPHPAVPGASETIEPSPGLYRVDFAVDAKGTTSRFRAIAISDDVIELAGRASLRLDWLATLTLRLDSSSLLFLATIETCHPHGDSFVLIARPFGLATGDRPRWQQIVETARRAHRAAVVASHLSA